MIAIVTPYYNPSNRSSKTINYFKCLELMPKSTHFTIEWAWGSQEFTLPKNDHVFQVRSKDLIWQQYRLVNRAIQLLPDQFDKVVWVDADIVFSDPTWIDRMEILLDQFKVVQSFESVTLANKGDLPGETRKSVAKVAYENSLLPHNTQLHSYLDLAPWHASGFSWGMRREVFDKFGVYDYWITGSSDTALCIALWGDFKNSFFNRLNVSMKRHYLEWAIPFHRYISGSVSFLPTHITHLYHGERNYRKRWRCLQNFDPYSDIRVAENGCFEWCSDNSQLHECCETMCLNYDQEFPVYL